MRIRTRGPDCLRHTEDSVGDSSRSPSPIAGIPRRPKSVRPRRGSHRPPSGPLGFARPSPRWPAADTLRRVGASVCRSEEDLFREVLVTSTGHLLLQRHGNRIEAGLPQPSIEAIRDHVRHPGVRTPLEKGVVESCGSQGRWRLKHDLLVVVVQDQNHSVGTAGRDQRTERVSWPRKPLQDPAARDDIELVCESEVVRVTNFERQPVPAV